MQRSIYGIIVLILVIDSFVSIITLVPWSSWSPVAIMLRPVAAQYHCRDPDLGGNAPTHKPSSRKFLLIHGSGAGIGNFLVFFPAAYYFAALTGRDILIQDNSLIGEMCSVVHCGFPKYSEYAAAFPSILNDDKLNRARGIKAVDFHQHFTGQKIRDVLVRADGYKYQSGWYLGFETARYCIAKFTGCGEEDVSCHDRYALTRLVRGPFNAKLARKEEPLIAGVPVNMKHGILTLPHAYAPRFDAAVHLRCNFRNFENLVGPDDTALWPGYVKEVNDWLYSTQPNAGKQLFQEIERKIMEELHLIREQRDRTLSGSSSSSSRRRALLTHHTATTTATTATTAAPLNRSNVKQPQLQQERRRQLTTEEERPAHFLDPAVNVTALEYQHEHSIYHGTSSSSSSDSSSSGDSSSSSDLSRVYLYIASDNERVKEALAEYLIGHAHISVMRVKSDLRIVHGKNVDYLRAAMNGTTGLMNLVLDWYSLSLANVVFAWRQDTAIISSFAQSAQRMGGNYDLITKEVRQWSSSHSTAATATAATPTTNTEVTTAAANDLQKQKQEQQQEQENSRVGEGHSRGYQLVYSHGRPVWRFF